MKQAIAIVNYSDEPLEIVVLPDATVDGGKKVTTIPPKDSYTFFLDRIESLNWSRPNANGST